LGNSHDEAVPGKWVMQFCGEKCSFYSQLTSNIAQIYMLNSAKGYDWKIPQVITKG
jgi:hypothetical protein